MFTAALFIIAETWKQPKCPLTAVDREVVHISMDYYSAIKENECHSPQHEWTWRLPYYVKLERKRQTSYNIACMWSCRKPVVTKGLGCSWGVGGWEYGEGEG